MAVHLLLGWVSSDPLPFSSILFLTCSKSNAEDVEFVGEFKVRYELQSFSKYKEADVRSAANKQLHNPFDSTTYHDG